ncbi:hypothetical protein WJX84_000590 [Apatococcus fuscideae]|uniref:Uncharacterized protein n=1 Tax=Apatococcus fuscideae TaxID=2026836 RepID=A0AAW1T0P3_9CHLO
MPDLAVFEEAVARSGYGSAAELQREFKAILATCSDDSCELWQRVSKELLRQDDPFVLHQKLHQAVFRSWTTNWQGPAPIWIPTAAGKQEANLALFMQTWKGCAAWEEHRTGDPSKDWPLLQRLSWEAPEAFWPPVLRQLRINFAQPPTRMYEVAAAGDADGGRWLPGARLNIAESCLEGRDPDAPAVVWADEASPRGIHTISLGSLRQRSLQVAAALNQHGIQAGAAIAVAMPMTPESVAIYLGIILSGCAAVSIADSFAPSEIASRLKISQAALIFTQDHVLRGSQQHPMYAKILKSGQIKAVVLPCKAGAGLQVDLRQDDTPWQEFVASGRASWRAFRPHVACSNDVCNILFSSGTTGEPKAIPWTHVTPIRCGANAWAHQDVRNRDVVCWPTSLGWMMGPWLVFAALLNGAAIALFNGAPLARPFGEFVDAARVTMLGVVPSIVRAWRGSDCMQGLEWGALRCFSSTGEASSPEDYHWLVARGGYKPVMEYCGGTEIGGGFLSGTLLQPQAPATFSTPTIGTNLVLLGPEAESGRPQERQQSPHVSPATTSMPHQAPQTGPEAFTGELALVPPMLGSSQQLLNRDHFKAYYEGMPRLQGSAEFSCPLLRRHGDEVERLPNGYYVAHGRSDDTMNLGGIKVSSVELEKACTSEVGSVMEAAAVAVPSPGGGPSRLALFLVLRSSAAGHGGGAGDAPDTTQLRQQCQQAIRSRLNPLFKVTEVQVVRALPRTASNKVMRRLLRDQVSSKQGSKL